MGLSLETFSDERFAHVFGDRQARKYSETIHPCDTKRTGRVTKTGNKQIEYQHFQKMYW